MRVRHTGDNYEDEADDLEQRHALGSQAISGKLRVQAELITFIKYTPRFGVRPCRRVTKAITAVRRQTRTAREASVRRPTSLTSKSDTTNDPSACAMTTNNEYAVQDQEVSTVLCDTRDGQGTHFSANTWMHITRGVMLQHRE